MSRVFSNPRPQFIKDNGEPNAAGKIYFYEPGVGSSTLKSVYSDYLFQSALTNPVILDGNGKTQTNIFLNGDYKWVITDSAGVTIETGNNYDPPELDAQFGDWDATITYAVNDFVRGSNGSYYQSLSSGNVGNNPVSAPQYWVQKFFQDVWNQYKTYSIDEIVKYGGDIWVSLQNSNTGNTPSTSSAYWRSFFEPSVVTDYTAAGFDYRNSDGFNSNVFAAQLVIGNSFESIGPTGSGATNIWTAMNDLPEEAKMVVLSINSRFNRTGTTDALMTCRIYARQTGGSALFSNTLIGEYIAYGGAASNDAVAAGVVEVTVPLDASNRFDFAIDAFNQTSISYVSIRVAGYKI